MHRTLTLMALLGIAALLAGCSSPNKNSEGSNSTGAYNSSPSGPSPVISSNSNTASTTTTSGAPVGAPPPGGGKTTGIKPPMKNEKQK